MSTQDFPDSFREALWETWSKRCFWGKQPLKFSQLEVDHIIPESLLKEPEKLKEVLQGARLPADFNVQGYGNLVPSCRSCNGTKSDIIFDSEQLILLTAKVKSRLKKLDERLKAKRQEASLEEVVLLIVRAQQRGEFSFADLQAKWRESGYVQFLPTGMVENDGGIRVPVTAPNSWPDDLRSAKDIVFVTQRALNDLMALQLTADELRDLLLHGVKILQQDDGTTAVVIDLAPEARLYVKYRIKGDRILVMSCHLTV
jgi:hypothetical protein